ncbi:MAG: serine hydrolase [Saprospiraceae bacterium]
MRVLLVVYISILFLSLKAQEIYFPPITDGIWETSSPISIGYCQSKIDSLYHFLESENTKAFILLKDGKIVLEKYFGVYSQNSILHWASAGKTITSFMVGLAQQEGYLHISDPTSKYLGEGWTNCTPAQEGKITIRHQLTMTSGLDDGVPDPFCTIDTCLEFKSSAGLRWAYHNAPYTLLDGVIEDAVGKTLNSYVTQKLKNITGMTGSFIPIGYNNVFFSNARSMARFGLLILNKGNWDGNQILSDDTYFDQMVNTSQSLNPSYGYLWWLNGKSSYMIPQLQFVFQGKLSPNAPDDMISAMGKGGQFLNIVPSENLVWLRMGDEPNNILVPFLLNDDIWAYVNDLKCVSASDDEERIVQKVQIFPNPFQENITVKSHDAIVRIEVLNASGQILKTPDQHHFSTNELEVGMYFIKVFFTNGKVYIQKLVKI